MTKPSLTHDIGSDRSLRWSRRLSFVSRWGIAPMLRRQSVAEHCFHVARTALWLIEFHQCKTWAAPAEDIFRLAVLEYALSHDDEEAAMGDGPGPTKKRRDPSTLTQSALVVKCADILELIAFVHEEQTMGNSHGMASILESNMAVFDRYWQHFDGLGPSSKPNHVNLIGAYLAQIVSVEHPHPIFEVFDAEG